MPKDKKIALTITANTRQLRQDMRRASGYVKGFERQITGLGARMRAVRMRFQQTGIFGRGGGMLRTAAGFAGAYGFQQMISGAKDMDAALTDIAITGKLSGKQLIELKKLMFEVSNATGKSTTEVLSFVSAMTTATGDTAAAMVALKDIGDVAVSTGADMGALGEVFVKLTASMKVLPKEARQAFNILRSQEMVGAITMAQLATALPDVVGAAGIMGESATGLKGVRALGGLLQLTRRGTDSTEQAKTATSKFLQDMYRNRKKMKKHIGVDMMDESGNVRDLTTIFGEVALALAKPGMLGLALEKGIFNVRSIKTATELAKAGRVGLGGKQGTLQSFNAIFIESGKIDEIGAGQKQREKSASFKYEQQMTILANTFKKRMLPLFGDIAESLAKFMPDIVKAIKFIFENSRGLLKLWLGYKGVTFFKNLMAPIQGGAMGAAGMVPGMRGAGAVMAGGGMLMGPGGQMMPAPRPGAPGFIGPMQPISRRAMAGRFMMRHGRTMGGGAGMAAGMAGMMGYLPSGRSASGDMVANMMLMSGNPWAMAIGGGYRIQEATKNAARKSASDSTIGKRKATWWSTTKAMIGDGYAGAVAHAYGTNKGVFGNAIDGMNKLADKLIAASANLEGYYGGKGGNWKGFEEKKRQDELMKKHRFGETIETGTGLFGVGTSFGMGPTYGMSALGKVALAKKLGEKGLKTLSARVGGEKALAKAAAIRAIKKGGEKGEITEEMIAARSDQYSQLKEFKAVIDKLIMVFKNELNINVHTVEGTTPGNRVKKNSLPASQFAPGGAFSGI